MTRVAKSFIFVLTCFILVTSSSCGYRSKPIYQVSAMTITKTKTYSQVGKIVTDAFIKKGWIIESSKPGVTVGRITKSSHTARVRISYSSNSLNIKRLSTTNLNYHKDSDGSETIHTRYNIWIKNLERYISKKLWQ